MRKPSPLPSIYQGSCLLGCCLGAVQKPFPATQPSHWHQLSAGRSAGTALLEPAAILAPAAPVQHPSCCQNPSVEPGSRREENGSAAAEMGSCGCEEAGQLGEEPAAPLAGLINRCTVSESLASPSADALPGRG